MQVGAKVKVAGRHGTLASDNEDGTWNVDFEVFGEEGDFATDQLVLCGNSSVESPSSVRIVTAPWSDPKPDGWTRFVCFSDTHGLHDSIPSNHRPAADVLLHAGDFTNTGELPQIESFSKWLEKYPATHKVVIAGNHDITFHEEYYVKRGADRFHRTGPYDCSKAKGLLTGCTYLEDSMTEVCGYQVYGSPWQPEFCDWAFNLPRGEPSRLCWEPIPSNLDILLVHGPPHGFGDRCSTGFRAGCEELSKALRQRAVSIVVAGHIHSDYGCQADDVSLYVNASTCTSDYCPTNPPIVFDAPPPAQLRHSTSEAAGARLRPK